MPAGSSTMAGSEVRWRVVVHIGSGQPELRALMQSPQLKQLAQRIGADYHIRGLGLGETFAYVYHRLKVAGGSDDIFSVDAIRLCYAASRGIPRLLNILSHKALMAAFDRGELGDAVAGGARRVLGLFASGAMSPAEAWTPSSPEPSLPQMAAAALDLLEGNPGGFFLLIEGSQVDWANHANDADAQLAEVLAFDDAVRVVLRRGEEALLDRDGDVLGEADADEAGGGQRVAVADQRHRLARRDDLAVLERVQRLQQALAILTHVLSLAARPRFAERR